MACTLLPPILFIRKKTMPIYEYQCKVCEHVFEKLIFKSDETVVCPVCYSKDTQKLISATVSVNSAGCASPSSSGFS